MLASGATRLTVREHGANFGIPELRRVLVGDSERFQGREGARSLWVPLLGVAEVVRCGRRLNALPGRYVKREGLKGFRARNGGLGTS